MATLPDALALGERPAPQPSGGVAAYEPPNFRQVGMAGQLVQQAGREQEETANILAATNERQDNLVAQDAANQQARAAVQAQFDPKTGWANAKEGQAVGQPFIDDNMSRFTATSGMIRDKLANDNQRKIFDAHTKVAELVYQSALFKHQAEQTDKFNGSTENATLNNALAAMARAPGDELNFQTGMVQINGTIDQSVKRRGLPPEAAAELKSKYLTAAYSTRILSTMNGIPGVAPANPYEAEKLFKQVQDQLQPEAQVHLAAQVQKGVQSVQQRDTAQSIIFGKPATMPSSIAPAAAGSPLQVVVHSLEAGGKPDVDADGKPLQGPPTSQIGPDGQPLRAQGGMQVMGPTAADPGYGVRPAQLGTDGKPLPGELERVGRDYLGAMTARYDNPALVLAAYNAGPARADAWIAKYGDPRSGSISAADWANKIPFAETQKYVVNGLRKLNVAAGQPNAPIAAPTANNLKVDLYARVQYARDVAAQQYPGDTAYADAVASRVENLGRTVIANQQGIEAGARDQLFAGIAGTQANGSDKPTTIDQLLADPQQKANWDKATPETKLAIQAHFKNGAGDPPRTADTQKVLYTLMGAYSNDRQGFANTDLAPYIPFLPHADFDKLASMQVAARSGENKDADKQTNLLQALSVAQRYGVIAKPKPDAPKAKQDEFATFTGALSEALDKYHTQNGKPADQNTALQIARNLTTQVTVPSEHWYTRDQTVPAFKMTPEQEGTAQIKIAPADATRLTTGFAARYGRQPSSMDLQLLRMAEINHANDPSHLQNLDALFRQRGH